MEWATLHEQLRSLFWVGRIRHLWTSTWDTSQCMVSWCRWESPISSLFVGAVYPPVLSASIWTVVIVGFITFAMKAFIIIPIWQLRVNKTIVWQQMENGTIPWYRMSQVVLGGHQKPHRTWKTLSMCAKVHGGLNKYVEMFQDWLALFCIVLGVSFDFGSPNILSISFIPDLLVKEN